MRRCWLALGFYIVGEKTRRQHKALFSPSYPAPSLLPTFPNASGPSVAGQDSQTCKDGSKPSEKPKPQRILEVALQTIKPSSVISETQICQILPGFASRCETPAEAKNHSDCTLKKTCLPNTPCQGTHIFELFQRQKEQLDDGCLFEPHPIAPGHKPSTLQCQLTTPCSLTALHSPHSLSCFDP